MHIRLCCTQFFAGDLVVHLEEIPVLLFDFGAAIALDYVAEIQVDALAAGTDAAAGVALFFGGARGDVARREIAERGVFAFEIVIAFVVGNGVGRTRVAGFLGHPDATVVAQAFAHQSELRLEFAGDGDAGRVDLRAAGVGEVRAFAVGAPDRGDVLAFALVEDKDVAVAAAGDANSATSRRRYGRSCQSRCA